MSSQVAQKNTQKHEVKRRLSPTFDASLEGHGKGDGVGAVLALEPHALADFVHLLGHLERLLELLRVDAPFNQAVGDHVAREREGVLGHLLVQIQGLSDVSRL